MMYKYRNIVPVPHINYLRYEDAQILLNSQRLWIEVVLWMRNYFHSTLENLPDLPAVMTHVFKQIPLDFYNELSKYFGPEDTKQFLEIFSKLSAANWGLINAYKENNQMAIDESTRQWYKAGEDLASLMSRLNKHWDEKKFLALMNDYIQLKIKEIMAFLQGNYEQEIIIFNQIEKKAIEIANFIAMGIIARRPPQM